MFPLSVQSLPLAYPIFFFSFPRSYTNEFSDLQFTCVLKNFSSFTIYLAVTLMAWSCWRCAVSVTDVGGFWSLFSTDSLFQTLDFRTISLLSRNSNKMIIKDSLYVTMWEIKKARFRKVFRRIYMPESTDVRDI